MSDLQQIVSLFKNWSKLNNVANNIQTEIENFELLKEKEEENEWLDIDSNNHLEKIKAEEIKRLQKYAHGEFIAHELAYKEISSELELQEIHEDDGSIYQEIAIKPSVREVIEDDGSRRRYICTPIQVQHPGLVSYILQPEVVVADTIPELKIVFRGTKPNIYASMQRNLEAGGAGATSFAANKGTIVKQINNAIANFNLTHQRQQKSVNCSVYGHSLGGADAQNCVTEILQAVSQNYGLNTPVNSIHNILAENRDQLQHVKRLRLFTYNSAGVPSDTAARSADLVKFLEQEDTLHQAQKDITELPPVIEAYYQLVGGDAVQQTGEAYLFGNVTANQAKVDINKVHIGSEHHNVFSVPTAVGTIATAGIIAGAPGAVIASAAVGTFALLGLRDTMHAHTSHLYKKPITASYQVLTNASADGQKQVNAELTKKSWLLNKMHAFTGTVSDQIYNGAKMLFGFSKNRENSRIAVAADAEDLEQQTCLAKTLQLRKN